MSVSAKSEFSTALPCASPVDRGSSTYTERLFELIDAKLRLIESLHTLSQLQASLCPNDSMETILGIIGRRDGIVDQINALQLDLSVYQGDDPERRVWISNERREQCRTLSNRIQSLMQEIVLWDGQTLELMQRQRDALAIELQNGMDSQLAQRAYQTFDNTPPSIIDVADL